MSATNAFETALLTLLFNNTALANVGDASGLQPSGTAGSFYISLHTADPGEGGAQNTSEAAYTGYARVAVPRSVAGWIISGGNVSNAAAVLFGNCTASPGSAVTYFGIGSASSGAGNLFLRGALSSSYQPSIGNAPNFAIGDLDVNLD
jgi:hypothetical protein